MELHQIRYFLAACETLNFTRAAELRNVSQPALTKAIHMLEYELGGPLFDTQSRPIQLTAFGELLRDRFSLVEDMLSEIKTTSTKFHRMEDATFTIGIINTIGTDKFIDIVRRLQEQLLGVSLVIHHACQESLTTKLKSGKLELAIVTGYPIRSKLLEGATLYSEPYMLTVPLQELLEERNISVKLHLETDQDDFARQMIIAGLGLSIMPLSLITPPLKAIAFEDVSMHRELRVVHRKDRLLSPAATKVRDTIIANKSTESLLSVVKSDTPASTT